MVRPAGVEVGASDGALDGLSRNADLPVVRLRSSRVYRTLSGVRHRDVTCTRSTCDRALPLTLRLHTIPPPMGKERNDFADRLTYVGLRVVSMLLHAWPVNLNL